MSYPFFIWTVQRTGGTSLAELLMKMSEHKSAEHEPFNWRVNKPRQFAAVARNWVETKDAATLQSALKTIFDDQYLIKHCFELHGTPLNVRILQAAAKTNYRHILLLRRDELSRLVSKYIAEANGTWFKDYAAQVYAGIATGKRQLQPLPIDEIVATYQHVRRTVDRIREGLGQLGVEWREIWYEDIYTGDRSARMANLNALFEFLGFSDETIRAHQADIEEKIFRGSHNTADILQFVPNLTEVRDAFAAADRTGQHRGWLRNVAAPSHRHPGTGEPTTPVAYPRANEGELRQTMKGSGAEMSIFTRENGFVEESGLGYHEKGLNRLNSRYRTFMTPNEDKYKGKRVLDLASHDGRWSFAALKAGAAHVTGIEYRQDTIDKSRYIIKDDMRDKVRFIQGDIFEQLPKLLDAGEKFDVVQCFGIFYHVMDHHRLLRMMTSCGADLITVDTSLLDSNEPVIKLKAEPVERFLNAAPVYEGQNAALIGVVSRKAIQMLAADLGYKVRFEPWVAHKYPVKEGLWDYFNTNKWGGRRYTFYLEKA